MLNGTLKGRYLDSKRAPFASLLGVFLKPKEHILLIKEKMVENQTKMTRLKAIIVNFMLKREQSKQKICLIEYYILSLHI